MKISLCTRPRFETEAKANSEMVIFRDNRGAVKYLEVKYLL